MYMYVYIFFFLRTVLHMYSRCLIWKSRQWVISGVPFMVKVLTLKIGLLVRRPRPIPQRQQRGRAVWRVLDAATDNNGDRQ